MATDTVTFDSAQHPRAVDGKFTEKRGTAPDFTLDKAAAEDFALGQYVTFQMGGSEPMSGEVFQAHRYTEIGPTAYSVRLDDGNTWSGLYGNEIWEDSTRDSTENIARYARFNDAHGLSQAITSDKATRSERMHLADIEAGINEGMNEEWRNQATRAFAQFQSEDIASNSPEARLRELLDESSDDQLRALERVGIMEDERYEQEISRRTALAVFYRDRIDDSSDNWTQDHYDHLTRAWREAIGPVHPDDEERPKSWDATQHTAMSPARKFENISDRELESMRANAWKEYREAPDGLKLRAAQVVDAAADHRGIQ